MTYRERLKHHRRISEFVKEVEQRGGFCSLEDLNEIITLWDALPVHHSYDRLTPSKQLERMFKDLKTFKETNKLKQKIDPDGGYCKVCTDCKELKNMRHYYTDIRRVDGIAGRCIECSKEATKRNLQKRNDKRRGEV